MRLLLTLVTILLVGCDLVPRDTAGALERVRGGELRVGVSEYPPWVVFRNEQVAGLEPELIEHWAAQLDARVVWVRGSLAELTDALHRRDLDVLAAGLDARTPYKAKLALTQPYLETTDRYGGARKHVLAVTQGESALLLELDRYLARQKPRDLHQRTRASR